MARLRTQIAVTDLPPRGLPITLGSLGEDAGAVQVLVEEKLGAAAAVLANERFAGRRLVAGDTAIVLESLELARIDLPWGRLFDLTMNVVARYAIE